MCVMLHMVQRTNTPTSPELQGASSKAHHSP